MTEQLKKSFAELYKEYAQTSRALTAEHIKRIDDAFSQARAYVKAPNTIDVRAVRKFIMPISNKIATVAGVPDAMWARWHIQRTESVFIPLLKEIFGVAASCDHISREQFCQWRNEFFKSAGYKANQVFNRLIVVCFPKQFCSVIAPMRLKAANEKMHLKGLMASIVVDMKSAGAWFDLCEAIIPVVREGLANFDLASQISFLAALADGEPTE